MIVVNNTDCFHGFELISNTSNNEPNILLMDNMFQLESDDYFWICVYLDEKVITMNRSLLNSWATKCGLTPSDYKNKRLLLQKMWDLWDDHFNSEYHTHPH